MSSSSASIPGLVVLTAGLEVASAVVPKNLGTVKDEHDLAAEGWVLMGLYDGCVWWVGMCRNSKENNCDDDEQNNRYWGNRYKMNWG